MAGLGFEPLYAAALALLANTAPVAFGGFGIPILTGATVAGLDTMELSQMVGRQTPLLRIIIPGMLVTVMAGFRRMLEVWPVVAVSGIAFAGTQFVVSNVLGPELADLLAAMITVVAVVALLAVWRPSASGTSSTSRRRQRRELRRATSRAHALRLVALHHHNRDVSARPGAPDQGRHSGIQTAVNFPTAAVSETTGLPVVPWPGLDGQIQQTAPRGARAHALHRLPSRPTGSRRQERSS